MVPASHLAMPPDGMPRRHEIMIMVVGSKAVSAHFCMVLCRCCDFSHSSMTMDFGARWHGAPKPPGHATRHPWTLQVLFDLFRQRYYYYHYYYYY